MLRVQVYTQTAPGQWGFSILEVSRVPCKGEFVRPNGKELREVTRVVHFNDEETDTVGGITLKDA
jgi:hypothetical protein